MAEYVEARSCAGLPQDEEASGGLAERRAKFEETVAANQAAADEKAARLAAEQERHACLADPACKKKVEEEQLANVVDRLCGVTEDRDAYLATIQEEWRQAREETGLIDLESIRRLRTLKEWKDEEIYALAHAYKSLTGKQFSYKRACKAVAAK